MVETQAPKLVEQAKGVAGDAMSKVGGKGKGKGRRGNGGTTEIARPEDVS